MATEPNCKHQHQFRGWGGLHVIRMAAAPAAKVTRQLEVEWAGKAFQHLLISATKRSVIVRSGRAGIFVTIYTLALTIDAIVFHFTLTSKNSFVFQSLILVSFLA